MNEATFDVIIIGAGVAGLSAAQILKNAGLSIRVVEARGRIGGRIATVHDTRCPCPVELGAEFIHEQPESVFKWVKTACLAVYQAGDKHFQIRRGKIKMLPHFWNKVSPVFQNIDLHKKDVSFSQYIKAKYPEKLFDDELVLTKSFVEGFHAADPRKVSSHSLHMKKTRHAMFRFTNGYDGLIKAMSANLDYIYLNTAVTRVQWQQEKVKLNLESRFGFSLSPLCCRKVLVTVPLGVIKNSLNLKSNLQFDPPLNEKKKAIDGLEMGKALKVTLRFREKFWNSSHPFVSSKNPNLSSLGFLHNITGTIPIWWTCFPMSAPLLTGWIGGPKAYTFSQRYGENFIGLVQMLLAELATAFSIKRTHLEELLVNAYFYDWNEDPYSQGVYSYIRAGSIALQEELSQPIQNTIYFAGEALDPKKTVGTVDGAIRSGETAAQQILTN